MTTDQFQGSCPLVEFRQYSLVPKQRDVLVELFDREFVESQEALGMRVIGQFRDLDDPDRFVWLRGFAGMEERHSGLTAFYAGPVWRANRAVAGATMVDTDNVLLLRPARADSAFSLDHRRVENQVAATGEGFVVATLVSVALSDYLAATLEAFEETIVPALMSAGAKVLGYFVTEPCKNTYPALPVREGEHLFVFFTGVSGRSQLEGLGDLTRGAWAAEDSALPRATEIRRLQPTSRSSLTGRSFSCRAVHHAAIDGSS